MPVPEPHAGEAGVRHPGGVAPTTVFVLSGGANLGAVQVGMLKALLTAGIVPDAVIGASVGAINAAAVAADPTPEGVERLADVWCRLRRDDVFPGTRLTRAVAVARRRSYLLDPGPLRSLVARWIPFDDLADGRLPLHVATTELRTGRLRWWTSGPAVEVLVASACLPGVFPPVLLDGGLHVDGAVVSAVPVARAAAIGASVAYVLDAGSLGRVPEGEPRSALDVVLWTYRAARLAQLEAEHATASAGTELRWLPPVDVGRLAFDDFTRTRSLIAAGERAAAEAIAGLPLAS